MWDRFYAARDVLRKIAVRVRITRRCLDEIDGVELARFEVGLVYEVSASLGSYLIATGCAVAIVSDELAKRSLEEQQFRVNVQRWRRVAADATRKPRRLTGRKSP
jgi:hydrogenase maturation factor